MSGFGALGAASSAVINTGSSFLAAHENARISKDLAQNSERLGEESQRNSASNVVAGFKAAGLSPALASGGNFSAPAGISAPMGTAQGSNVDLMQAVAIDKQNELLDAQIANVNAQTQGIKNKNTEWSDENQQIAEYAQVMAQKWKNTEWYSKLLPDTQRTLAAIADGEDKLTIGKMRALLSAIDSQGKLSDTEFKQISNGFNAEVLRARFEDKDVFNAEVQKYLTEQNYTYAQIQLIAGTLTKYQAEIVELMTRGELNRGHLVKLFSDAEGALQAGDWAQYGKLKLNKFIDGCLGAITLFIPGQKVAKALKGAKALKSMSQTAGKRLAGNKAYNKSGLKMFDQNSSTFNKLGNNFNLDVGH